MFLNGRLDLTTMIGYWISQLAGAPLADLAAFSQDYVAGPLSVSPQDAFV
jgi:glycerol uptake facilitator-like aquaporin